MKTLLVYGIVLVVAIAAFGAIYSLNGGNATASAAAVAGLGALTFIAGVIYYVKTINREEGDYLVLASAGMAAAAGALAFAAMIPTGATPIPTQFVNTAWALALAVPFAAAVFSGERWDKVACFLLTIVEIAAIWLGYWFIGGQPQLKPPPWLPF